MVFDDLHETLEEAAEAVEDGQVANPDEALAHALARYPVNRISSALDRALETVFDLDAARIIGKVAKEELEFAHLERCISKLCHGRLPEDAWVEEALKCASSIPTITDLRMGLAIGIRDWLVHHEEAPAPYEHRVVEVDMKQINQLAQKVLEARVGAYEP